MHSWVLSCKGGSSVLCWVNGVPVWFLLCGGPSICHCRAYSVLFSLCFRVLSHGWINFVWGSCWVCWCLTFFCVHICWFNGGPVAITMFYQELSLSVCSFSFPFSLEEIFSAWCCRLLITSTLCFTGWWESESRYWSVCVWASNPTTQSRILLSSLVNICFKPLEWVCLVEASTSWVKNWLFQVVDEL